MRIDVDDEHAPILLELLGVMRAIPIAEIDRIGAKHDVRARAALRMAIGAICVALGNETRGVGAADARRRLRTMLAALQGTAIGIADRMGLPTDEGVDELLRAANNIRSYAASGRS